MGDFQCPSVLCGSFGCFGGMGISVFDSESCIRRWRSEESCTGTGVPFGLKVKRSTWYEHFGSSSLPPEHQRRSFQICASDCMF